MPIGATLIGMGVGITGTIGAIGSGYFGWAAGIAAGTAMEISLGFKGAIYPLHILGWTVPRYAALSALVLNVVVSVALSYAFNAMAQGTREDETAAADYV